MATGCTVTLTSNTEDSATKDDVGLASKPTVVSKSWTVSVDSLDVTDAAAMLTAIKSLTPFTLMWDETSTTDNQTGEQAAFARTGQAYLNDATFNFNDRENSTKSLQFTGSGELSKITTTPTYEPVDASVYTKGQFVRLFISSDNTTTPAAVIAAARQLSFHVSMTLENATTKDTPGDWQIQEPTGLSYDISSTALMRGNDTITSAVTGKSLADLEDIYEAGTPVKFQIANVSGDNQRTKGAVIVSGSVIIATLTLNGPNRQNADYTTALNGYGAYTVGA
jgi:predicted secreted protein